MQPKVNANGLVPVFLLHAVGKNFPNTVAGFVPEMAAELVAKKLATYDLDYAKAKPVAAAEAAAPAAEPKASSANKPKEKPAKAPPKQRLASDGPVEIPANWSELHFLQQIKLAKSIAGENAPNPMSKEAAIATITAEVARRASEEKTNATD